MDKHIGEQTICFKTPPVILSAASVVGPKEGDGPLGRHFDRVLDDILAGKDTWEQAESELMRQTIALAVQKSGMGINTVNYIFAGDLLNQNSGSVYGARSFTY